MNETEFREIGSMSLMKAIRIGLGLSGTQVTVRSGVGPARISLLERGLDQPRPLEREQLSRALKVPADLVDQRVRLFVEMPRRTARSEVVAASQ